MAPAKPTAKVAATRRSARQAGLEAGQSTKVEKPKPKSRATTKKAPRSPPTKYECVVCYREATGRHFPDQLCSDNCKHLINTCKDCLKRHIAIQLDMKMYDQISCSECPEVVNDDCIKAYGGKDASARYEKLKRKGIAEQNPGWFWCLNPKCQGGHVHESLIPKKETSIIDLTGDDSEVIFTCTDCDVRSCVKCERLWHDGKTCAQVRKQTAKEEKLSLATISRNCKPCPNCEKQIEKNGGCDAVWCTQCRTQFCWRCVTPYTTIKNTGRHGNGCLYNAPDRMDPHHMEQPGIAHAAGQIAAIQRRVEAVAANLRDHAANLFGA